MLKRAKANRKRKWAITKNSAFMNYINAHMFGGGVEIDQRYLPWQGRVMALEQSRAAASEVGEEKSKGCVHGGEEQSNNWTAWK